MVAAAIDEGRLPAGVHRPRAARRCRPASCAAASPRGSSAATTRTWRRCASSSYGYFAGTLKQFTLPLVARGTPFEERVWQALLRIPHGQTRSYLEIARELGSPEGQRAVGRANGLNRIAIVIPCHRVVNHGGGLGGYGGGLWRKERLLDLERGPGQKALFTD